MTLYELSKEYQAQARALRQRIRSLEQSLDQLPETERGPTQYRIRLLRTMWRETRDIGILCERYYERSYHRNAKYTL